MLSRGSGNRALKERARSLLGFCLVAADRRPTIAQIVQHAFFDVCRPSADTTGAAPAEKGQEEEEEDEEGEGEGSDSSSDDGEDAFGRAQTSTDQLRLQVL